MTTQLAVKLSDELVSRIDRLVHDGRFASRSHAVRAGLDQVVGDAERKRIDAAFADGFARHPDDDALAEAEALAVDAIEEEPWERWW